MPIKKKTEKKSEKVKQEKFWVLGSSIENGAKYSSFEEAKYNAEEGDVIRECVVVKKFVQKGWEEVN